MELEILLTHVTSDTERSHTPRDLSHVVACQSATSGNGKQRYYLPIHTGELHGIRQQNRAKCYSKGKAQYRACEAGRRNLRDRNRHA